MDKKVKEYLSKIGKKGGKKSRRVLDSKKASEMSRIRWSKHKKDAESNPKQDTK